MDKWMGGAMKGRVDCWGMGGVNCHPLNVDDSSGHS